MKMIFLIFFCLLAFIFFPVNIMALEYVSNLSGKNTIYSDAPNEPPFAYNNVSLRIDVSNIENIDSFSIHVQYDRDIIKVHTCSTLDYISTFCHTNANGDVVFTYQYSQGFKEKLSKYGVFYVNFGAMDTTPKSGTTKVNVFFLDAKDKEGNPITIDSVEKAYTLDDYSHAFTIPGSTLPNKGDTDKKNEQTNTNKVTNLNNLTTPSKSENKALKALTIDGYELEFDKQKTDYTIFIDEGVNRLTVKATPEDKNATYKVIGADDLTASKNIVRVEVTAQDKTKQTYYIRVKYEKKEKEQMKEPISNETEVEKKAEPVNHDILKWIGIAFGGFVGIGLIAFIISKIKDHSIDKKLDALDDD